MKLESQVCSLELAQKLKSMGVKQESLFYYDTKLNKIAWSGDIQLAPVDFGDRYISAFTVAELGETLPWAIESDGTDYVLMIRATVDGSWSIAYICIQKLKRFNEIEFEDMNEADCKAKMLVYLLENNLIN